MNIYTGLKLIGLLFILTGCAASGQHNIKHGAEPYIEGTTTIEKLIEIPDLDNQPVITIAVYSFTDQTGQRKPSPNFSQLSTAVTQGPDVWVISALKAVSGGDWFKVVERKGLGNIVKERQLIRSTRELYDGETQANNTLKPLVFAGLIIEGGIVGYDTNTKTGGIGARLLGIGVQDEFREDRISVGIRLVSVSSGEVLLAISSEKTILSSRMSATVFRFLDVGTKLLEIEAGYTENESVSYAVRKAIDKAVYDMIEMGIKQGLWKFKEVQKTPIPSCNNELSEVLKKEQC